MTNDRPLGLGIADRIDEFLRVYEESLLASGIGEDRASRALDEMEERIREELNARPLCRNSLSHLEEMLAGLNTDRIDAATPLFGSKSPQEKGAVEGRLPAALWFAAAWAVCFLVMLGLMILPEGFLEEESPGALQKLFVNLTVTLGILAPVGVTALGLLAIRQIRFARNRFREERWAMGTVLLFPTFLFAGGIWFLSQFFLTRFVNPGARSLLALFLSVLLTYPWVRLQVWLVERWLKNLS